MFNKDFNIKIIIENLKFYAIYKDKKIFICTIADMSNTDLAHWFCLNFKNVFKKILEEE